MDQGRARSRVRPDLATQELSIDMSSMSVHRASHKPVVAIVGPTAIGKSRIAIEVAKALKTEILTADSRQVYRGMDIGTDKPTLEERQGIPHRLIDLVDPDQHFTAGDYRQHASRAIDRLHENGRLPLVVGGTGLYIRVLFHGLWSGPQADWALRDRLTREAERHGWDFLYRQLLSVDPMLAQRLHPHDRVKIQRALEVYYLTGQPLSEAHRLHRFRETSYRVLLIGLTMDRPSLYARIDDRVRRELDKGLVEETRRLLANGYHRELGSMKSLGYRQIAGFLHGEYSFDEAVRRLKRDTRRFAKRQYTWFRKEPSIRWMPIDPDETPQHAADRIMAHIERFLTKGDHDDMHDHRPPLSPPHNRPSLAVLPSESRPS